MIMRITTQQFTDGPAFHTRSRTKNKNEQVNLLMVLNQQQAAQLQLPAKKVSLYNRAVGSMQQVAGSALMALGTLTVGYGFATIFLGATLQQKGKIRSEVIVSQEN